MKKKISDEFEITVGKGFIVGSKTKRKGAEYPEPYDANRIEEWLIQELGLKDHQSYTLKISASIYNSEKSNHE
jgi:hypothetical protein